MPTGSDRSDLAAMDVAGRIPRPGGLLHRVRRKNTFGEALTGLGWTPKEADPSTPLGELLLGAEYISQHQLDAALIEQKKSGLPIGRKLVLSGVLSESLISAAVNAQIMVRNRRLRKEQAIDVLKEARKRQVSTVQGKGFYDLPKRKTPRSESC